MRIMFGPWQLALALVIVVELAAWIATARDFVVFAPPYL